MLGPLATGLYAMFPWRVVIGCLALDVEALLAQPTLQDNELLMGFLQQRDEEGVRHTMAAHIRRTINLLDQAGFGSV